jgi:hypothetical protein
MEIRECVKGGPYGDFYVLNEDCSVPEADACITGYCHAGMSSPCDYVRVSGTWYMRHVIKGDYSHPVQEEIQKIFDKVLDILLKQEAQRALFQENQDG